MDLVVVVLLEVEEEVDFGVEHGLLGNEFDITLELALRLKQKVFSVANYYAKRLFHLYGPKKIKVAKESTSWWHVTAA